MLVRRSVFRWLAPLALGAWLVGCHEGSTEPSSEAGPLLYGIAFTDHGAGLARIDTGSGDVEPVRAIESSVDALVAGPGRQLFALENVHLLTFDATSGRQTHDVVIPFSRLAGFDASTGNVIVITEPEDSPDTILRIDPATGEVHEGARVEGDASRGMGASLLFDGAKRIIGVVENIAPNGVDLVSADVVVIDADTGSAQRIETGLRELDDAVLDPRSGLVYAVSGAGVLVSIDLTSGDVEGVARLPSGFTGGATFDAGSGRFLVLESTHPPNLNDITTRIVGVDVGTGKVLDAPEVDPEFSDVTCPAFVN